VQEVKRLSHITRGRRLDDEEIEKIYIELNFFLSVLDACKNRSAIGH
jgi:hypothetical protein